MTPPAPTARRPRTTPTTSGGLRITWLQGGWLALQLVGLTAFGVYLYAHHADDFSLLWRDPTGQKLLMSASIMLGVQLAVYLGGCVALNWMARRMGPRRLAVYRGLCFGLAVFCFVGFYLPVTWMLTVGPAAIKIQQNLRAE